MSVVTTIAGASALIRPVLIMIVLGGCAQPAKRLLVTRGAALIRGCAPEKNRLFCGP